MIDLHRHDEYSTFDGFGKPEELAEIFQRRDTFHESNLPFPDQKLQEAERLVSS